VASNPAGIDTLTAVPESVCRICPYRKDSVFSDLAEPRLEDLCGLKLVTHYRKDQRIFYESEPNLGLHILCSGKVKLSRSSKMGRKRILAIAGPCGLLEEKDLFRTERHTVTAEAMEDCVVCFVKRDEFLGFLQDNPPVALRMIERLAGELEEAEEHIQSLLTMDVKRRLADLLLRLADRYGRTSPEGRLIDVALTREELSEMIGATQETVSRALSAIRKVDLIAEHGKRIVLLNEERLKRMGLHE
jgi:CRP/FNR family transcriptional regulator